MGDVGRLIEGILPVKINGKWKRKLCVLEKPSTFTNFIKLYVMNQDGSLCRSQDVYAYIMGVGTNHDGTIMLVCTHHVRCISFEHFEEMTKWDDILKANLICTYFHADLIVASKISSLHNYARQRKNAQQSQQKKSLHQLQLNSVGNRYSSNGYLHVTHDRICFTTAPGCSDPKLLATWTFDNNELIQCGTAHFSTNTKLFFNSGLDNSTNVSNNSSSGINSVNNDTNNNNASLFFLTAFSDHPEAPGSHLFLSDRASDLCASIERANRAAVYQAYWRRLTSMIGLLDSPKSDQSVEKFELNANSDFLVDDDRVSAVLSHFDCHTISDHIEQEGLKSISRSNSTEQTTNGSNNGNCDSTFLIDQQHDRHQNHSNERQNLTKQHQSSCHSSDNLLSDGSSVPNLSLDNSLIEDNISKSQLINQSECMDSTESELLNQVEFIASRQAAINVCDRYSPNLHPSLQLAFQARKLAAVRSRRRLSSHPVELIHVLSPVVEDQDRLKLQQQQQLLLDSEQTPHKLTNNTNTNVRLKLDHTQNKVSLDVDDDDIQRRSDLVKTECKVMHCDSNLISTNIGPLIQPKSLLQQQCSQWRRSAPHLITLAPIPMDLPNLAIYLEHRRRHHHHCLQHKHWRCMSTCEQPNVFNTFSSSICSNTFNSPESVIKTDYLSLVDTTDTANISRCSPFKLNNKSKYTESIDSITAATNPSSPNQLQVTLKDNATNQIAITTAVVSSGDTPDVQTEAPVDGVLPPTTITTLPTKGRRRRLPSSWSTGTTSLGDSLGLMLGSLFSVNRRQTASNNPTSVAASSYSENGFQQGQTTMSAQPVTATVIPGSQYSIFRPRKHTVSACELLGISRLPSATASAYTPTGQHQTPSTPVTVPVSWPKSNCYYRSLSTSSSTFVTTQMMIDEQQQQSPNRSNHRSAKSSLFSLVNGTNSIWADAPAHAKPRTGKLYVSRDEIQALIMDQQQKKLQQQQISVSIGNHRSTTTLTTAIGSIGDTTNSSVMTTGCSIASLVDGRATSLITGNPLESQVFQYQTANRVTNVPNNTDCKDNSVVTRNPQSNHPHLSLNHFALTVDSNNYTSIKFDDNQPTPATTSTIKNHLELAQPVSGQLTANAYINVIPESMRLEIQPLDEQHPPTGSPSSTSSSSGSSTPSSSSVSLVNCQQPTVDSMARHNGVQDSGHNLLVDSYVNLQTDVHEPTMVTTTNTTNTHISGNSSSSSSNATCMNIYTPYINLIPNHFSKCSSSLPLEHQPLSSTLTIPIGQNNNFSIDSMTNCVCLNCNCTSTLSSSPSTATVACPPPNNQYIRSIVNTKSSYCASISTVIDTTCSPQLHYAHLTFVNNNHSNMQLCSNHTTTTTTITTTTATTTAGSSGDSNNNNDNNSKLTTNLYQSSHPDQLLTQSSTITSTLPLTSHLIDQSQSTADHDQCTSNINYVTIDLLQTKALSELEQELRLTTEHISHHSPQSQLHHLPGPKQIGADCRMCNCGHLNHNRNHSTTTIVNMTSTTLAAVTTSTATATSSALGASSNRMVTDGCCGCRQRHGKAGQKITHSTNGTGNNNTKRFEQYSTVDASNTNRRLRNPVRSLTSWVMNRLLSSMNNRGHDHNESTVGSPHDYRHQQHQRHHSNHRIRATHPHQQSDDNLINQQFNQLPTLITNADHHYYG